MSDYAVEVGGFHWVRVPSGHPANRSLGRNHPEFASQGQTARVLLVVGASARSSDPAKDLVCVRNPSDVR